MGDLPDWTTGVDIVAQTITDLNVDIIAQTIGNLAVNIAAAAITLDVNIAAAAVTLNVNIASAVTLNVNLAASAITLDINIKTSAITLNVDVTAQTVGNLTISINAQSVGVYLQPDWQAYLGKEKTLTAAGSNIATGAYSQMTYTVPAGKTLYITHFSGSCVANLAASRDLAQHCYGRIKNDTTGASKVYIGGDGGFGIAFPTPIAIPAGEVFQSRIYNAANHTLDLVAVAMGYEV